MEEKSITKKNVVFVTSEVSMDAQSEGEPSLDEESRFG